MTLHLVRAREFQCAHYYEVKEWTLDENLKEFGPCFSPEGHGHTYRLEAHVTGMVNPTTGMILNLRDLDAALKKAIAPLEGKHLNLEVLEFKNLQPTTENILLFLVGRLEESLKSSDARLTRAILFETDDLWVECVM